MARRLALLAVGLAIAIWAPPVAAQNMVGVYLTNVSKQIISPPVVITHAWQGRIFMPGMPASAELTALAEDGDPAGLAAALEANEDVLDVVVADGPLMPGETRVFMLETRGRFNRISAVGMLVTSNDAFFGLDNYRFKGSPFNVARTTAPAWDAGSEFNSEDCDFIPGPPCGSGGVRDTAGAEGFIHIHPGLHGDGELSVAEWGWQNPVVDVAVVNY
jgi:hypothetical protein